MKHFFYPKIGFILSCFFFFAAMNFALAQSSTTTSNTDPQTGVRVTTKITPLPSLSDQVSDLERKTTEAGENPTLVQNGTYEKFKLALAQKRKELEAEEAERRRINAAQNR